MSTARIIDVYINRETKEKVSLAFNEREIGYYVYGEGGPLNTNFKANTRPARFVSQSTWEIILEDHGYEAENPTPKVKSLTDQRSAYVLPPDHIDRF